MNVVSLGCFDVLHIFSDFFIRQLIAFVKLTTKHHLPFSHFFRPFCLNSDAQPVSLRTKINKTLLGLSTG